MPTDASARRWPAAPSWPAVRPDAGAAGERTEPAVGSAGRDITGDAGAGPAGEPDGDPGFSSAGELGAGFPAAAVGEVESPAARPRTAGLPWSTVTGAVSPSP